MRRLAVGLSVAAASAGAGFLSLPARAEAQANQVGIFQDDARMLTAPGPTLLALRELGVGAVRVTLAWNTVAPAHRPPAGFKASDPASYPAANWNIYDQIVQDAHTDGIAVDFSVTGPAPLWAAGSGQPAPGGYGEWKPSTSAFLSFVEAVATRYSGSYDPVAGAIVHGSADDLPRVTFWELWNEPNFGQDLAPQAIKGSSVPTGAPEYRSLLEAGWSALGLTGHGRDTIVIGNLAARGTSGKPSRAAPQGYPGNFGQTKPLQFIRTLYCVDSSYRELRGAAAAAVGCPTNAAGSRSFRRKNPALFNASGFATHPYPINKPPTQASSNDPDFTEFSELPRLATTLDRLQRIYGSGKHYPIYNNEYGYITNPPNHSSAHFVSPTTAAYYDNWAEYLSWRSSRIANSMQFLLYDPNPTKNVPEYGGFASGLIFYGGARKPGYNAYRLPLFLPVTSVKRGRSVEVWGCLRPAHFARLDSAGTPQQVQIQFQRGSSGAFTTLRTVTVTNTRGYFDLHMTFPASGSVRLAWSYPPDDALLTPSLITPGDADTVYSRTVTVKVG
ncbi:MAG TPA: hypothetical protein VMG37_22385 [Solirubrobacteraceae bacterium]|nr:hypothetical protein [Solirubrobacteraceae bacterium]